MIFYKTDNLALCAFLQMHGLKYINAELGLGKNDRPTVYFIFEDPKTIAKDLELEYMRSDIKRYRDLFFFFRNEIDRVNRQLKRVHLNEKKIEEEKKYNITEDNYDEKTNE